MARLGQLLALLAFAFGIAMPRARAESASDKPLSPEMRAIDVDERRGAHVDPGLAFVDHEGNAVDFEDYLDDERPVLVTLNYYRCRVVCSVQLDGLARALRELDWTPGDENFRVVTVSLDPEEQPEDAAKKRATLASVIGRGDDIDWQFLTGDELQIKALAAALGVRYAYDAEQDQYAHPAVAMFLAPDGKIVQYIYGLTFDPADLKLALLDAGEGKIGSPMEKLYQSCFSYDPTVGRYGPFAFGIMRIGAVLSLMALSVFLIVLWRRERKRGTWRQS
jgi:protein SCO1/2